MSDDYIDNLYCTIYVESGLPSDDLESLLSRAAPHASHRFGAVLSIMRNKSRRPRTAEASQLCFVDYMYRVEFGLDEVPPHSTMRLRR